LGTSPTGWTDDADDTATHSSQEHPVKTTFTEITRLSVNAWLS
jgi:hypothetical protein